MSSPRLAYGSLHQHGAGLLPDDLEGVDYLLLDGGRVVAPDEEGPEALLAEAIRRLAPALYLNPQLKVIASLAGRAPVAAARRVGEILSETGSAGLPLGVVRGSRVLDRIEELIAAGQALRHEATGEPFTHIDSPPRVASLAFDAEPLVAAAQQGARVVFVGHADLETVRLQLLGEIRTHAQTMSLTIKLETGAAARLLVRSPDVDRLQRLAAAWLGALEQAGLPAEHAACKLAAVQNAEDDNLLAAVYRSQSFAGASDGLRLLRQLVAVDSPSYVEEMGPQVQPEFETWPTNIPTDLVEWAINVQPAKEWIE